MSWAIRPPRSARAAREVQGDTPLRRARTCYDHLAGVAGVELLGALLTRRWLRLKRQGRPTYVLTHAGARALTARGVDLETRRATRRPFARACRDWTERRPHLAGALGAAVLRVLERRGLVRRRRGGRTVRPTSLLGRWLARRPA